MEFVSEIAENSVFRVFEDDALVWDDAMNSSYTEEAQDFYNEEYDYVETLLNGLGVYSDNENNYELGKT